MRPIRCIAVLASSFLLFLAVPVAVSSAASTPFAIQWTAPGDDSLTGRATSYDLRHSGAPITAANFSSATRLLGIPAPALPGTPESFVISGLLDGTPVYLAIKTADEAGNWSGISNLVIRPAQTTGVGDGVLALSFSSPWPNPARQSVRWAFALPQAAPMQVEVLDIAGRHVQTVASGDRGAGRGELSWDLRGSDGRQVGAGVYFVKAKIGATEWTKRLTVVR
jgi:hypothetical protein